MASPPGLAFETLRMCGCVCVDVCVNDEFFCADEEGSECRDVKESRVNEPCEREESELRAASLASLTIKKIV